ncbi:hypothetical protein AHF37_03329 [Paragonimus kellicotti]|nr:hypothetical protein AHF37_03329 [Paragonimus kellicotti]
MQPALRAKSVTQEALSLLEAYLDLDDEAEDQVDSELPHISSRSFPRGKNIHSFERTTHGDPNKWKNRLKKYSLRDPWVQITNPCNESAKNQCSFCSRDVHHDTPRSDLSVSCSPTLALHANQRGSPTVGHLSDRPCSPTQQVQADIHRDLAARIPVSSLASEPSSPLDAQLMPLFHISPTGSEVDRVDGLVDRFQRQQSAFSTSSSFEPHSSLTSDPISRTPSHVRSGSLLHSNLTQVDTHQTPVHRSQSVGNAVVHQKSVLLPADPTVSVANANATRSREPYLRGISVHSAPGEARYKVPTKHSQSRTGPNRWYRISLPKITRITKMSNQRKPSRVLPGIPAAWSSQVVPDSTLPRDASPSRPKPSRTSRGARDTFAQLFPRRLRSGQDGLLSGPYLTGGVGLFLRKPMFAVFRRKKRSGRQFEQTELDSQFSLGTAEAHLSSSGDQVHESLPATGDHTAPSRDERYANGPWTAVFGPGGDCTSLSHSPNTVRNKFSSASSPSTKLANHEVTRIYKELIQKAEGDRLSSSAAEVWRDINVLPNTSGNVNMAISSLASEPSSPLDAPLMPLFHISPTGSEVDRVDGLVDRFQRQQSAFSTSSSFEPHSSLTSDPISRTPSHVRSGSLLHSNLTQVDTHQTPVHRSQSVGNAVVHQKSVLLPADPTVSVANANATRSREPYLRGISVHSAPGEARYKVPTKHSQSRTGPNRWYRISLPKITRITKMSNQRKPSRVLPGIPAAWSSQVVPDSTLPRDASPSRPKPSRTSRGARDTFAQLFPRRLRSGQDGLLSGPYLTGGVGLFLRKPMFAVFRRKKRSGRQFEQTELDSQFSLGTAEAHLSSSGDQVHESLPATGDHTAPSRDERYANGPWTAVFGPGGDCTSLSHSPNTVRNKFSSASSPSTKLANHEVTRIYKELIQKAEGDRLSSSAAEVWRDINVLPNTSGNVNMASLLDISFNTFYAVSQYIQSIHK